jgi:hypothetical protein
MTYLCSVDMSFQINSGVLGRPRFFPSIFTLFRHTLIFLPFDAVPYGILTVTSENIKVPENCNVPTPQLIHSTSSPPPRFIRKRQHLAFTKWKSKSNNGMNASELLGYECIILFSFPFAVELSVWTRKKLIQYTCDMKRTRKWTCKENDNIEEG